VTGESKYSMFAFAISKNVEAKNKRVFYTIDVL
jgi:hypothetical protein